MDWKPLLPNRLDVDSIELAKEETLSSPQLAKDVNYARAIQDAWRSEAKKQTCRSESTPITYKDSEGAILYGHVMRRIGTSSTTAVPGILFFHTAAGPHDVCLRWKADSLVTDTQTFPDGCVVLIADILSDDTGWGWSSDRTKFNQAREYIMTPNEDGVCTHLQGRLIAALDTLKSIPGVDHTRLAAMGWCLGGRAVLELSRMQIPGMKAMVTFHGVFDGRKPSPTDSSSSDSTTCQVLICNGDEDPFVSQDMLHAAVSTFRHYSCETTVLDLPNARHGFTNPAQDFNPNPSFGYQQDAAIQSWNAACSLLQRELAPRAQS